LGIKDQLEQKFDGGLPGYLKDYFDSKDINDIKNMSMSDEEFWEHNQTELVKQRRKTNHPVFTESSRNTERVEEERNLSKEEIKVLIKLCEDDMYLFAIRYFPHYLKKPSSELHKFIYELLSSEINNKERNKGFKWAVAAPRSHAKSSLVSAIFPLWCICYNKKKFIILVSNTAGQAEDFLSDVKREILHNEKLKRDFPHIIGQGPIWRASEIITSNDVKMLALGSGNQIRGRRFGVYRPDLIVGDDIESSEDIASESKRDFLRNEWFDKDVLFAGGGEDYITDFFIVGTILGSDSLLNNLVNPTVYPDWNSKIFRAVIKFSHSKLWNKWAELYRDRFNDNRIETARNFFITNAIEMLEGTEVLWPEGDPYYNNMIEKFFRPSAFETEKMNSGSDPTKILIKMDQLHFKRFSSSEIQEIIKSKRRAIRYGALDPSLGKKSDSGDFSCIVTLVRDLKSGYLLVEDIMLDRISVEGQIQIIIEYHNTFHYHLFGIETNAFQYVVAESLRKTSRELGIPVPIKELPNYLDKKLRFEGIISFLVDGTIIFDLDKYENDQQYAEAIDQLCLVTGKGDSHDDSFDALEMAVRIARAKKFKRITKQNKEQI